MNNSKGLLSEKQLLEKEINILISNFQESNPECGISIEESRNLKTDWINTHKIAKITIVKITLSI